MLATDHGPLIRLLEAVRKEPGVKRAAVASGIRMDLAVRSPAYIRQIGATTRAGIEGSPGTLRAEVLRRMHKPPVEQFEAFAAAFRREAAAAGKKQFLVPYLIAGHPGSDLPAMIALALT